LLSSIYLRGALRRRFWLYVFAILLPWLYGTIQGWWHEWRPTIRSNRCPCWYSYDSVPRRFGCEAGVDCRRIETTGLTEDRHREQAKRPMFPIPKSPVLWQWPTVLGTPVHRPRGLVRCMWRECSWLIMLILHFFFLTSYHFDKCRKEEGDGRKTD
jgi:hypothetical protein